MRKLLFLTALLSLLVPFADAQRFDVALGISGIKSTSGADVPGNAIQCLACPPASVVAPTTYSPQDVGGGVFPGFSADVLLRHGLGVEGELFWRAHQNIYNADLSGQPFRPLFWAINGIYSKNFSHRAGIDLLAGLGEESVRFYQNSFTSCDPFSGTCTNYTSTGHFMADLGAGLRLYVKGGIFLRPEMRLYLVHNNFEFSSGHAERLGVSLGYTFGER